MFEQGNLKQPLEAQLFQTVFKNHNDLIFSWGEIKLEVAPNHWTKKNVFIFHNYFSVPRNSSVVYSCPSFLFMLPLSQLPIDDVKIMLCMIWTSVMYERLKARLHNLKSECAKVPKKSRFLMKRRAGKRISNKNSKNTNRETGCFVAKTQRWCFEFLI